MLPEDAASLSLLFLAFAEIIKGNVVVSSRLDDIFQGIFQQADGPDCIWVAEANAGSRPELFLDKFLKEVSVAFQLSMQPAGESQLLQRHNGKHTWRRRASGYNAWTGSVC